MAIPSPSATSERMVASSPLSKRIWGVNPAARVRWNKIDLSIDPGLKEIKISLCSSSIATWRLLVSGWPGATIKTISSANNSSVATDDLASSRDEELLVACNRLRSRAPACRSSTSSSFDSSRRTTSISVSFHWAMLISVSFHWPGRSAKPMK